MDALYFTATWCQPCKVFGPVMEKVSDIVNVHKFDIENDPATTDAFDVMSVPTVVFLKDNKEYGRFVGARTEDWVRDFIEDLTLGE